ncbi:hypothetical protein EDC04DRAFT_2756725 [Pisolithus marmoratus]|nr:hypothetical protein EDC04DRAFT_2756725 [Pisolithus marmoratus]
MHMVTRIHCPIPPSLICIPNYPLALSCLKGTTFLFFISNLASSSRLSTRILFSLAAIEHGFPIFLLYGMFPGSVPSTFWHPLMVIAEPDQSPQPFIHPLMSLPDDWLTSGESGGSSSSGAATVSPSGVVSGASSE